MSCPFRFDFDEFLAAIRKRPMKFPAPLASTVWKSYGAQFAANGVEMVAEGGCAVFRVKPPQAAPKTVAVAPATTVKVIL